MNEGLEYIIGTTPTIVQSIIGHMTPWGRTQHAPLVCKRWEMIVKDPSTHVLYPMPTKIERRMAIIVLQNILQDGPYTQMMRKCLPASCALRNFCETVDEFCDKRRPFGMSHAQTIIFKNVIPDWYDHKIDPYPRTFFKRSYKYFKNCKTFGHIMTSDLCEVRRTYKHILYTWRGLFITVDREFWVTFAPLMRSEHKDHVDAYFNFLPMYKIYQRFIDVLRDRFGITNIILSDKVREEFSMGPMRETSRKKRRKKNNT